MRLRTPAIAALFIGLMIGLAAGRAALAPADPAAFQIRSADIMATAISIEAPADQIDRAAEIVFSTFREVDERMSEWKETSPLSLVNRSAGSAPAPVPADLRDVLRRAIDIGAMTDGAFDLTWAALWGLWDFRSDSPTLPTEQDVRRLTDLVDYRLVEIDDQRGTVFLPRAGMLIGLGGIAKGYAIDRAAAALETAGIRSYLLSAGGQVAVGETRPGGDGRPWRIGIRDPRGDRSDYFATIDLTGECIATSGDYESFFVLDGQRYHHILDPRTGRPSRGVRSVAVISRDATLADALSTALMVMGVERGLAMVERTDGVDALMVDDAGRVHASSGCSSRLRWLRPPAP